MSQNFSIEAALWAAIEASVCEHEFGPWVPKDALPDLAVPKSWRRSCNKCGMRETVFVPPCEQECEGAGT